MISAPDCELWAVKTEPFTSRVQTAESTTHGTKSFESIFITFTISTATKTNQSAISLPPWKPDVLAPRQDAIIMCKCLTQSVYLGQLDYILWLSSRHNTHNSVCPEGWEEAEGTNALHTALQHRPQIQTSLMLYYQRWNLTLRSNLLSVMNGVCQKEHLSTEPHLCLWNIHDALPMM